MLVATEWYPQFISWRMNCATGADPGQVLGGKLTRRIRKAQQLLAGSAYRFTTEAIDEAYVNHFLPLYQHYMEAKVGGGVAQVQAKLQAACQAGRQYESISLWAGDTLLGSLIYNVRADRLSVAYRVFPRQLGLKLPISCSYVGEYQLLARAQQLQKPLITHGRDRNVYGQHAAIGLAMYKLSIGCFPVVASSSERLVVAASDLASGTDLLIFLLPSADQNITSAVLLCEDMSEESTKRYNTLLHHPALHVELRSLPSA